MLGTSSKKGWLFIEIDERIPLNREVVFLVIKSWKDTVNSLDNK
ncbi:Putative protein [Zobellia galactanivorans]|uniref:Uncharacterized protein n=1 Tax=Zobellia galactanivorans (strain DSM 12802 / CCUG 47099 / CIP 106680 / NCIMB 13871 / Dsij) TaxID=63186 RepID=G0LB94_ZOBGA|nr:Putative protein [Zobellia galactanivorans]